MPTYDSPSRLSVATPIKDALKRSNNDTFVFLDRLNSISSFKNRMAKLEVQQQSEVDKENDEASHL